MTQLFVIPSMTDGSAALSIGGWFGTGADRGIALVFVVTGVLGVVATLLAPASRSYRRLTTASAQDSPQDSAQEPAPVPDTGLPAQRVTDEPCLVAGSA